MYSFATKGVGHYLDYHRYEGIFGLMLGMMVKSFGLMLLFHVVVRFLPCCCKKVVECAGTSGGVLEIAFLLLRFSRY